jgi:hypothetical protein
MANILRPMSKDEKKQATVAALAKVQGAVSGIGTAASKIGALSNTVNEDRNGAMARRAEQMSGGMAPQTIDPATKLQPIPENQIQQLQDAQMIAQQMPVQVRAQAEPVLASALEEAMRRRMGGYV